MKKVRYITGLAGLAPVAAGVMTGTAAHAALAGRSPGHDVSVRAKVAKTVSLHHLTARGVSPDLAYSCFDFENGHYGWCNAPIIHGGSWLYSAGNAPERFLPNGARVKITCWYKDSFGIIQDHVVREHIGSKFYYSVGHVSDYFVNFSNQNPSVVGLNRC